MLKTTFLYNFTFQEIVFMKCELFLTKCDKSLTFTAAENIYENKFTECEIDFTGRRYNISNCVNI